MIERLRDAFALHRTRFILGGVALLLLLVNLATYGLDRYRERLVSIDNRQSFLARQRVTAARLPLIKEKLFLQETQRRELEKLLFRGRSEEEISSSIQVMLQRELAAANLTLESLRPRPESASGGPTADFSTVAMTLQAVGPLDGFTSFLAALYRAEQFLKVESFSVQYHSEDKVKVSLDLKGFYRLG